nr:hypothetical protein [Ornithinimicrobium murale]
MFEHVMKSLPANRQRRGSTGGRPVSYDTETYKRRNVVERSFNLFKHWRAPPAMTSSP